MRAVALIAALAVLSAAPARGMAQTDAPPANDSNAGTTPIAGDSVYKAFHEKAGIDRVVARLVKRYHSDPRLKDIFAAADDQKLARLLAEQLCYITGGGCHYSGKDMKAAHRDIGVQVADFNALVEDLQASMDDEQVPSWAQNRLLAKLAPMERVVVTR